MIAAGTLLGRYEIRSKIGEGGMGQVYLAQDTKLDRKVALKILPGGVASDRSRMNRFVQEAKAASALNHPNILTIYEIDQIESTTFIATEFIDGDTLRHRMREQSMKLGDVIDISIQIAVALSAAHATGIVHRDIKPENVMLRSDGVVKILDFGLAKLTESRPIAVDNEATTRAVINTEPGVVLGTAIYMSPEQARGLDVDARTDIFSLGVVMYELVTGRLPFDGSNNNEILASIISDKEPQPLARYSNSVPSELERIVAKALRKNRDARYQTSRDLLLDLKSLKQRLDFESQLERSAPSAEPATDLFNDPLSRRSVAATTSVTSSKLSLENALSGIKQHKLIAAFGLAALLIVTFIGYRFFVHRASTGPNKESIDSIAVMPFENMTQQQNTEYLSDGVTESLINSLSQLPHVRVIARNSVFQYKNQKPDLQQVASRLNVRAVLTGRVIEQGDTLSISVELTDTQNNSQLWGQHYTRKDADIFEVQEEIARQVTDALRVRLTGSQEQQVTKRYTENTEAYRLYLQGRYYLNQLSPDNLKRAISFFDQAIAIDPHYALAYAARAETYFQMGDISLSMSDANAKAKQDLSMALSIDDKLIEARTTLANLKFQYEWDFRGAEEEFKRVIALNPNFAEAHHQYAWYLTMLGKPMEGEREMVLSQQLDPANPVINVDLCLPYYLGRRFDEAIVQGRKAVDMFPNFFLGHIALGQALFEKGDHSKGIEELELGARREFTPNDIDGPAYYYARVGRTDEARRILAQLKRRSKERYVAAFWIAIIHVGLGEKDEAFDWLEKAYQDRSWWLVWIKMDPRLDSLRSDPRFKDLEHRIGFPE